MSDANKKRVLGASVAALLAAAFAPAMVGSGVLAAGAARAAPAYVQQGWTDAERELYWNSPQGSRIVPYAWFLALEQLAQPKLFASGENLAGYGYLESHVSALNPDGLPIGFAKEPDRSGTPWLGMTCAACHVNTVAYKGKSVLLDGAGANVDTLRFDRNLSAALAATAADDARFDRFAVRLGTAEDGRADLRQRLRAVAADRVAFTAMNAPPHPHGPGRVDALGVIMNALTATALEKPDNARAPDAPVRLPWLWNSPSYARVQYNGSISNAGLGPLLRNIGQVLGVYGRVDLTQPALAGYAASVSVKDLEILEGLIAKLQPPPWPDDMLPPIDKARAETGRAVFVQACAGCHQPGARDATGLIPTVLVPLDQIGTDPRAARNFMTRPAETGRLEGRPIGVFAGPVFGPRAGAATIVGHVSTAVSVQVPRERLQAELGAYRAAIVANPGRLDAYKATPLAGIWANAPYLHNGSVASLQQLLLPPAERAARFTVGGRDYDPVAVGYPADTAVPGFVLDTALPGNSNGGHTYGTGLSETEKADLIEYLKTL